MKALRCGDLLIPWHRVDTVDCSELASLKVTVCCPDAEYVLHGNDAIEAVLAVAPSAMEGKRLTWVRGQWALHNLAGHPAMQLLAWLRCHRAALWVHDWTVPRPRLSRSSSSAATPPPPAIRRPTAKTHPVPTTARAPELLASGRWWSSCTTDRSVGCAAARCWRLARS